MSDEDQLTPNERDLEQVLRSLRPVPARLDAVAAALAAHRRQPRRQAWLRLAAAAAIIIAIAGWWSLDRLSPDAQPPGTGSATSVAELPVVIPATELVYRRALLESPAQLDALLDRQATLGGSPENKISPVGAALIWGATSQLSTGAM